MRYEWVVVEYIVGCPKYDLKEFVMNDRMFEVEYDGVSIGLVKANDQTIAAQAQQLWQMTNGGNVPVFPAQNVAPAFDPAKLTWSDQNAAKFQHMM